MPFGGALIAGIGGLTSGLAGLFGGGKQSQQNTNQTTTQSGTQSGTFNNTGNSNFNSNNTGFSSPVLSPLQQMLAQQFTKGSQDLYNKSQDMSGYTAGGLQNINNTSNAAQNNIAASLAARGMSYSPMAATADVQSTLNRAGQQSQFLQQIPLLQRQMQQQAIQQMMGAFQVQPYGTSTGSSSTGSQNTSQSGNQNVTSSGTSNTTGVGTTSGNPLAGLFGGLGSGLMGMLPYLTNNMGNGNGGDPLGTIDRNIH